MSADRLLSAAALACTECGYDLSGTRGGRCPECGATKTRHFFRTRPTAIDWIAAAILAAVFLGGVAVFIQQFENLAIVVDSAAFSSGVIITVFSLGLIAVWIGLFVPKSRLVRWPAAVALAFALLLAPFCAYILTQTVLPIGGDLIPSLIVGGLIALNATAGLIILHRLLYAMTVYTPIPLHPPTLGVLGAGQLGRMLGISAANLGVHCRFLDASTEAPASASGEVLGEGFDDPHALERFARGLSVVTYEFENVPLHAAHALEDRLPVRPSPRSLEAAQDRQNERELFDRLSIPTPTHAAVETLDELRAVLGDGFPLPAILKTRRLGYDGKGQARIHEPTDAAEAWATIAAHGKPGESGADLSVPAMLDEMIPFERELSVVAVRAESGETRCYPPFENTHARGILTRSVCPAPSVSDARLAEMTGAATKIGDDLGHIGVFAVEFFETGAESGNRLLANEIAPRVHNTGHGTIEGCETSQFENHLRAVLGLPLGSTDARGLSAMLNIIGAWPDRDALLAVPGLSLHDYEKAPKPRRKIGHVTVVAPDRATLDGRLALAERVIAETRAPVQPAGT